MANTSRGRRAVRAEALAEVLDAVRAIQCPDNKGQGWATEFTRAVQAIARVVENQLAQAEGRVVPRKKRIDDVVRRRKPKLD